MDNKKRDWLAVIRNELDMTQQELADRLGVSNRTISNIELGAKNPSGKLAYRIAQELGFNADRFYEDCS